VLDDSRIKATKVFVRPCKDIDEFMEKGREFLFLFISALGADIKHFWLSLSADIDRKCRIHFEMRRCWNFCAFLAFLTLNPLIILA